MAGAGSHLRTILLTHGPTTMHGAGDHFDSADPFGPRPPDDARAAASLPAGHPQATGSAAVDAARPRLQILHIMIWTAVTAMMFSLKWFFDTADGESRETTWIDSAFTLIYVTITAAQLTGAALVLFYRRRRAVERLQPGHWLLLSKALLTVFTYVMGFFWLVPAVHHIWNLNTLAYIFTIPTVCLQIAIDALAAIRCREWRWRLLFILAVASVAIPLVLYLGIPGPENGLVAQLPGMLRYANAVVLLFAVIADLVVARRQRDWLHWLGVTTVIVMRLPSFFDWVRWAIWQ